MLTLEYNENTIRMNVASLTLDILLQRHLLPKHLILNLFVMKSKRF